MGQLNEDVQSEREKAVLSQLMRFVVAPGLLLEFSPLRGFGEPWELGVGLLGLVWLWY